MSQPCPCRTKHGSQGCRVYISNFIADECTVQCVVPLGGFSPRYQETPHGNNAECCPPVTASGSEEAFGGCISAYGGAGHLFGLLLIPTPVFLGGFYFSDGWVGGWVGGMGRFEMISPHGLAPFWLGPAPFSHLLSPSSPSLMPFSATRCISLFFE